MLKAAVSTLPVSQHSVPLLCMFTSYSPGQGVLRMPPPSRGPGAASSQGDLEPNETCAQFRNDSAAQCCIKVAVKQGTMVLTLRGWGLLLRGWGLRTPSWNMGFGGDVPCPSWFVM